jgi:hypothetical protein
MRTLLVEIAARIAAHNRFSKGITLSVLLSYSVVKEPTSVERADILPDPPVRVKRKLSVHLSAPELLPLAADTATYARFSVGKIGTAGAAGQRILGPPRCAVNFAPRTVTTFHLGPLFQRPAFFATAPADEPEVERHPSGIRSVSTISRTFPNCAGTMHNLPCRGCIPSLHSAQTIVHKCVAVAVLNELPPFRER